MGTRIVTLRMHEEQAEILEQMAAEQGESFSAYVRGRIFARDSLEGEFHALQSSLLAAIDEGLRQEPELATETKKAGSGTNTPTTALDPQLMGILLEILLLLRTLSNPNAMQTIKAEVARQGFKTFG